MTVELLFLRGVNVGGHRKLAMADLCAVLGDCGAEVVQTYIQSGNAVYRGRLDPVAVGNAIDARLGFRPHVQVRSLAAWRALVAAMPWPEVTDHKALHLFLTDGAPACDAAALVAAAGPQERVALVPGGVWLHTPQYLSGSRLAPVIDRLLGVPVTARNWRSVLAMRDMAEALT